MSNFDNGYELAWDAEIENEGQEFVVAEPGDYDFQVMGFERARFNGSDKMPACNQARLSIKLLIPGGGECIVKHNLFLHSKSEWKLCQFFTAIGQRKKGQKAGMNWNAVIGATGRCKVTKRSYKHKTSGAEMWSNDIEKFYEPKGDQSLLFTVPPQLNVQPPQGVQQTMGGYTVGKF